MTMADTIAETVAGRRAMFLVWGPPSHGPRSQVFARELGIQAEFVEATRRRGWMAALAKYPRQLWRTSRLLRRERPDLVFVQSPPSFAVLAVAWYCGKGDRRFIVDAHSDALQAWYWTRPAWLHRSVARRAVATIVTNERFAERIRSWGARALVIRDIPTEFPVGAAPEFDKPFNLMVVSTYASDEPLEAVLAAAAAHPDVGFHVTGDPTRSTVDLSHAPDNVRFTGFLDREDYYALMANADGVMCLTTRDDTMQRGACEALSMARPIITSDWPMLREYFSLGTVHVGSDAESIGSGVASLVANQPDMEAGIKALQERQRGEWIQASGALARLLAET